MNLAKSGVKHIPSALGKAGLSTLKDTDALIETGCVIANNLIECGTTGEWDFEKMLKEAGVVFGTNYFMNFATDLAFGSIKSRKNITDVEIESNIMQTLDDQITANQDPISNTLDRYNELMNIKKSQEYIDYMENARKGYAQNLRLDFNNVDSELKKLESILEDHISEKNAINKNILDSKELNNNYSQIFESNSKKEADELYRQNKTKYKQLPGHEEYYRLQELTRTRSNLDRVSQILDEWGKKYGADNYSSKALRKYADTGSVYQNINGKMKPYITSSEGVRGYIESLDPEIISTYLHNRTLCSGSTKNLNKFFKDFSSLHGDIYGVDQGGIGSLCEYSLNGQKYSYKQVKDMVNNAKNNGLAIPKFKKEATIEYFKLKDKLISQGLTSNQASVVLSSVNDFGACSYAAKANSIFYKFSDNPALFEEKFGFSMYKVNKYGERVLNSNELLLDMYLFANDTSNGGKLFTKNVSNNSYTFYNDDRIDFLGRKMLNTKNQVCLSKFSGSNNEALERYLKSKNLEWSSYNLINNNPNITISDREFDKYIDLINNSIVEGKAVQLNIFSKGNEIRMLNKNPNFSRTTKSWGEGGGHAVFVTGINNKEFNVSSWGREYVIPFKDLKKGGKFNIMIDDIKSVIY